MNDHSPGRGERRMLRRRQEWPAVVRMHGRIAMSQVERRAAGRSLAG